MNDSNITVNSLKFDRKVRRTWTCELLRQTGTLIHAVGVFDRDISHPGLGDISRGTISHEYYWTDRWYNVFRFHEPDGAFRNYYCNVAMPAEINGGLLRYVDLDMDLVVWKDMAYEVMDRDDFAKNTEKYGYPPDIIQKAEETLVEMIEMVEKREFPFLRADDLTQ